MENKSSDGDPIPVVETNIKEGEGKMVNVDFSSENKIPKDLASDSTTLPSSYRMVEKETTPETIISSGHEKNQGLITTWATGISPSGAEASDLQQLERSLVLYDSAVVRQKEGIAIDETSSEGSAQLPKEMIYLDDIQELESPSVSKEGNLLDQRMFKFRSSAVPIRGKIGNSKDEAPDQGRFEDFHDQKLASRSFKKNRNSTSRRLRRSSVSGDGTSMNDVECSSYYGESSDSSLDHEPILHVRQKHHKRNPMKPPRNTYVVQEIPIDPSLMKDRSSSSRFRFTKQGHDLSKSGRSRCSSEHPRNSCTLGEKQDWDYMPQKPIIQLKVRHCCCSCQKNRQVPETKNGMPLNQEGKKYQDDASPTLIISTCSGSSSSSRSRSSREGMPSYSRAMTMPLERDKEAAIDSMLRSNSFPLRDHDQLSSNRHVHPKLPDYDELAAKFMALKKANLQRV